MFNDYFTFPERIFIESNSQLAAMGTFLNDLEGDPLAPNLLLGFTDRVRASLENELALCDGRAVATAAFHGALDELRGALEALESEESLPDLWEIARDRHRNCQRVLYDLQKKLTFPSTQASMDRSRERFEMAG